MKRLINIIEQDAVIWDLSKDQVASILATGIYNKIYEMGSLVLSEDTFIDAWVDGLKELMPNFEAEIIPYKGIDTYSEYTWAKDNPNSWVKL